MYEYRLIDFSYTYMVFYYDFNIIRRMTEYQIRIP